MFCNGHLFTSFLHVFETMMRNNVVLFTIETVHCRYFKQSLPLILANQSLENVHLVCGMVSAVNKICIPTWAWVRSPAVPR